MQYNLPANPVKCVYKPSDYVNLWWSALGGDRCADITMHTHSTCQIRIWMLYWIALFYCLYVSGLTAFKYISFVDFTLTGAFPSFSFSYILALCWWYARDMEELDMDMAILIPHWSCCIWTLKHWGSFAFGECTLISLWCYVSLWPFGDRKSFHWWGLELQLWIILDFVFWTQ